MKSFITSVGNPIAFFVMFFMPGAIHDLGGNMYRITFFGVVVLVALGYLYLAVCALFRMAIKRKSRFIDYIGQISATMFRLAVVGLIAPSITLRSGRKCFRVFDISTRSRFSLNMDWILIVCDMQK